MAHCCVQILKPKKFVLLLIRSVHIKPLPDETNKTDALHGISRPKPRNLTSNGSRTCGQRLLELSHAPPKILDSQLGSQPHAPPRRPCCPPIYLAWESGGHATLHAPTRAAWVSVLPQRTGTRHHVPSTRRRIHTDVIRWRHHSKSAAMQAPLHQP